MRIVTVRRISQIFFVILFLWFCIVSSLGEEWWRLRGWPVNWLLQLDPLVALGTALTTGALYSGLAWALVTVALTILFGRFFCGWVCPFGALHQFVGYLGRRGGRLSRSVELNRYSRWQALKYYILAFLLSAAGAGLVARIVRSALGGGVLLALLAAGCIAVAALSLLKVIDRPRKAYGTLLAFLAAWSALAYFTAVDRMIGATLQTGLLDPIPLIHRSVNLVLLPLADATSGRISPSQRYYEGAWLIGAIFIAALLLNLKTPRFYCRFLCPLGALYGVLGWFALWKVGTSRDVCKQCKLCEANCEGGCEPAGLIRAHECVLCMNCLDDCEHGTIGYRTGPSASGEAALPDLSRRGALLTIASGAAAAPLFRLGGILGTNRSATLIRPPGALSEADFLTRCIKCGQCMRVCPTNIIQPAGMEGGAEALWTPVLNYRIGSSGCRLNCIACGHVCPTAAIRPLTTDEKLGRGPFAGAGPIRMGMAFVDRGRCLPWAMDRPCIVCQENCPVSPKAIFTQEHYATVRGGVFKAGEIDGGKVAVANGGLPPGRFATGDYFLAVAAEPEQKPMLVIDNTAGTVTLAPGASWKTPPAPGSVFEIKIRLQRPQVDPERCIGCGVCEHECPVHGQRAIRVSAENESRSRDRSLLP
jgi:polyferredoxin